MKRTIALLLTAALLLTGCGREKDKPTQTREKNPDFGLNAETGRWEGQGGSFVLRPLDADTPGGMWDAVIYEDELLYVGSPDYENTFLFRGAERYPLDGYYTDVCPGEEGLWVLCGGYVGDTYQYFVSLVSPTGETRRRIDLSQVYRAGKHWYRVYACGDMLYFRCDEDLVVISQEGAYVCAIPLPDGVSTYAAAGGDGNMVLYQVTESGSDVYLVDADNASAERLFSCGQGMIYGGSPEQPLLLANGEGLYALQSDGSQSPIVLWAECGLSVNGLYGVIPLEDGSYLLRLESGMNRLEPVDPADMKMKTPLTIASYYENGSLSRDVAAFNAANDEYYVQVLDYSDGGAFDEAAARNRLTTELVSGKFPDMILFDYGGALSPYPYIRRGLLTDLKDFFAADSDIRLEDIAVAKALDIDGHMYFIGSSFDIDTVYARYEDFGDRLGWTLSEYLEMENSLPTGVEMMHNMTRERFLEELASRYISRAVDWETGTCRFDDPAFVALLESSARVRQNPEDPNNPVFGFGSVEVANGSRKASDAWIHSVWSLAQEQKRANIRLSTIGWPTADGHGGSTAVISPALGILAQGSAQEGCWEFIKFMLMNGETDVVPPPHEYGLPIYLPALKAKLEAAKAMEDPGVPFGDEEAERFLNLVGSLESTNMVDETVLNIILEESGPLFAGSKSAEDTARAIQSRVSIYVAEQK